MLGCQDFCGYYEWTFHYLRRRFGQTAVESLWSKAIALDSQRHYIAAGAESGLLGLYNTWSKTGEDEKCDWTVDLDEERNVLHVNMHNCPSKGFLILNNRNADEDYCDHCIGWIVPALKVIDAEVSAHEHNHCGQCWWEFRKRTLPQPEVENPGDIRNFDYWQHGYLDTFLHGIKQSMDTDASGADSVDYLIKYFHANNPEVLTTDEYLEKSSTTSRKIILILNGDETSLQAVAKQLAPLSRDEQPLLVFPHFPNRELIAFPTYGLPRPCPILPLLIRARVYTHKADQLFPTDPELVLLIRKAFEKLVRGDQPH